MRTIPYYLLITTFMFFSLTLFSCDKTKTEKPNPPKEEEKEIDKKPDYKLESITEEQKTKILTFFTNSLSKNASQLNLSQNISPDKIENFKKDVWNIWKEANYNFSEEKLIQLSPLSEKKTSSWNIPSNLEPNAVLNYALGSKNGNSSTKFPLYVILHGSGDKHTEWSNMKLFCNSFNIGDAAYFIPQIPNTGGYYRWWQKGKQYVYEKLFRQAFISDSFNSNRFYFTGYSEGAYGSQRLASFYADYIAGAAPAAGGEPIENAPAENCANIAFSLRTGSNDDMFCRNGLTQTAKDEFANLQSTYPQYYKNFIELIPGAGHGINYNPSLEYLKDFSRNPYPKFVNWEIYAMDGIVRSGFYNILKPENLKKGDEGKRTNVKMEISGNTVKLTVSDVTVNVLEREPNWSLPIKSQKTYTPIPQGTIKLFLCQELVDLTKPVIITVNGKEVFNNKVEPSLESMVNSCATFFDPMRVYPAMVEVKW